MHFFSLLLYAEWTPLAITINESKSKVVILERDSNRVRKITCVPRNRPDKINRAKNEIFYTTNNILKHQNIIRGTEATNTYEYPTVFDSNGQIVYQEDSFCYTFQMPYYKENIYDYLGSKSFIQLNIHQLFQFIEKLAIQILSALYYLNRNQYAHLDVKPDNIMIAAYSEEGIPSEFILIDLEFITNSLREKQGYVGTLDYLPPEMLIKIKRHQWNPNLNAFYYPALVDMYELGVTILEIVLKWIKYTQYPRLAIYKVMIDNLKYLSDPKYSIADYIKEYPKMDTFLDFIRQMTHSDKDERIYPTDAINHRWIQSIKIV
eukprot:NODE_879_length_3345_cov_0.345040.p2 type:complete len:319 gc:universal NODE_879_length_3345_cov_0.345040:2993-2037(-)